MSTRKQASRFALISLLLSLMGLVFLPFLLLNPPSSVIIPWQTQLIGGGFALICILGIIAGISPSHCTVFSKTRKKHEGPDSKLNSTASRANLLRKKGHHPTCDHYSNHVLRIQTRIVCAGCTGLVIGAVIALIGTSLFFFANFTILIPVLVFWLGWVFVAMGLLQHYIYRILRFQHSKIRFLVNVLFVIGAFLLLASLTQLTNNLILAFYLLILILYWIFTRIAMSRRSHRHICAQCGISSCPLSDT